VRRLTVQTRIDLREEPGSGQEGIPFVHRNSWVDDRPREDIPDPAERKGEEKERYQIAPDPGIAIPILARKRPLAAGMPRKALSRRAGTTDQKIQRRERSGTDPIFFSLEKVLRAMGGGKKLKLDVAVSYRRRSQKRRP